MTNIPDNELRAEIIYSIECVSVGVDLESDKNVEVDKKALVDDLLALFQSKLQQVEVDTREEQIMQDFISLIDLPPNFEEQDLIEWRIGRIKDLKGIGGQ